MMTHDLAKHLLAAPNVPVGVIAYGVDGLVAHEEDDYVEVQELQLGDVWCLRDRWRTIKGVRIKATPEDIVE
jgi:hypothetical protein